MNYLLGFIYLIIASQYGTEAFIQALVLVLLFQIAWHMKSQKYRIILQLLAMGLSLIQPKEGLFWFFILYALANLLFHKAKLLLPFAALSGLLLYGYVMKLFSLEVVVLLLALFLLSLLYKKKMGEKEKLEEDRRKLSTSLQKIEKQQLKEAVQKEALREYYILEERSRLSRELHDSVGHGLSTQLIQLKAIESIVEKDPQRAKSMLISLGEFTQNSMDKVRRVLADLKPPRLLGEDVSGAIMKLARDFEDRHGITVNFQFSRELGIVEEELRELFYRAVREFLNNSLKHADATRIDIILLKQEEHLYLTLKDNGKGCDEVRMNLGLRALTEFVFSLDGEMDIDTAPGEGFILKIGVKQS